MKRTCLFLLLAVSLYSCDRPQCKNTNPIFDRYGFEQKEYKAELIKQLKLVDNNKLTYWIDQYIEREGKAFMSIYMQGGNLCARGILDITSMPDTNRLYHYKLRKGGGYSGAELRGLTYRIDSSNGDYQFIYEKVAHIID